MILPRASPLREVNAVMENVQLKAKSAHTSLLYKTKFIAGLLDIARICAGHVARMRDRRGDLGEKGHLEDPSVDGDNIKIELEEVGCGGMDWIDLAQDRDRWRAFVNAVLKLRVP
jgi:hypothetical protein